MTTPIHYRVRLTPVDGAGRVVLEDTTEAREGETPEDCVRREAAEAGWHVLDVMFARPLAELAPPAPPQPASAPAPQTQPPSTAR